MESSPGFLWPQSPPVTQGGPVLHREPRDLAVSRARERQSGRPALLLCRAGVFPLESGKGWKRKKNKPKAVSLGRTVTDGQPLLPRTFQHPHS